MVGTLPGRTQGLGLVTEPLLNDLHLNRVDYATINLIATLIGAAFCVPVGHLVDRFGARLVLTFTALSLGLTVLFMSSATAIAAMFVAITLTRGLGQSALSVVSLALVGKWFSRAALIPPWAFIRCWWELDSLPPFHLPAKQYFNQAGVQHGPMLDGS